MKELLKNKYMKSAVGILAGAILGFTFYYFIGCRSGACAITGNPVNSTLYGAFIGLVWTFPGSKKNSEKE